MKKKLFSILLSLAMVVTMMPMMAGISFAGEANTTVSVELVKAQTSGSKAIKLSWAEVSGATKYVVYGQKCGKSYKKLKTTSGTSYTVKQIKGKKLRAHKAYKFYVAAYSGSKKLVTSKSIHFITGKTQGKYANAKSISVKPTTLTLEPGKTATLKATTKIYKNKKHIKKSHGAATRYLSDTPAVATVNASGVVTAVAEGTATIYVQDIGGLYCKTIVTVEKSEPPVVHVTGVSLNKTEIELKVGDDQTLIATVAPDNATDKSVNWSSDKESVATVDNEGNVHAVAAGNATIKVTTVDGNLTATCEVKVTAASELAKGDVIKFTNADSLGSFYVLDYNASTKQAKVVAQTGTEMAFNGTSTTTTIGGNTCQKYEGSNLDTWMNNYYNSMPEAIKGKVVAQSIKQSAYSENLTTKAGEVDVGSRYVYALDMDDVKDMSNDKRIAIVGSGHHCWLRSALADNDSYAWYVYGNGGNLNCDNYFSTYEARAAFVINMDGVDYQIVTN